MDLIGYISECPECLGQNGAHYPTCRRDPYPMEQSDNEAEYNEHLKREYEQSIEDEYLDTIRRNALG